MSSDETILFLFSMCLLNILSFTIGAKIGQKVVKGERIKSPIPNPVEVVKDEFEKYEVRKEQERDRIIRDNIDSYNGFSEGQQDIPR